MAKQILIEHRQRSSQDKRRDMRNIFDSVLSIKAGLSLVIGILINFWTFNQMCDKTEMKFIVSWIVAFSIYIYDVDLLFL